MIEEEYQEPRRYSSYEENMLKSAGERSELRDVTSEKRGNVSNLYLFPDWIAKPVRNS